MALHLKTTEKLEDRKLCDAVSRAVRLDYSRIYIQRTFGVSRRELERIIQYHVEFDDNEPLTEYGKRV
ncbi:MAG: hypothetical protein P9L92_03455 [Candidatus Electryonea clarkiae]|nr:hypothetical protein [Candidatus Electryonea clarkiae]MDP8285952.1 hypothetical protein [Candidatus Electryonea clarkiae]